MNNPESLISLCFLDTNIWLYAFVESQDQEKSKRANAVIQASDKLVSPQVINEVCVNLIKKLNSTRCVFNNW